MECISRRTSAAFVKIFILTVTFSTILPFPIQSSMKTTDLLKYLKASMEKTERKLNKEFPALRRRIKSPVMKDYEGSPYDYIGKDEAPRRNSLQGSSQLDIGDAYNSFLRNHLSVRNEKGVPPDYVIRNPASIEYRRKLFCRSGYLVEILPNGTVRGTQDHNSPYTLLTILMYARQLVIIRTRAKPYRYLVMTSDGKVKAVPQRTIQSVFFYGGSKSGRHNYLNFQRAYKRRKNWYLALKKRDNGQYATMKKGRNTNPNKRSAQFIAVRY